MHPTCVSPAPTRSHPVQRIFPVTTPPVHSRAQAAPIPPARYAPTAQQAPGVQRAQRRAPPAPIRTRRLPPTPVWVRPTPPIAHGHATRGTSSARTRPNVPRRVPTRRTRYPTERAQNVRCALLDPMCPQTVPLMPTPIAARAHPASTQRPITPYHARRAPLCWARPAHQEIM